jgi:hypothetical protein
MDRSNPDHASDLPWLGTEILLPIDIMTGTHHYQSEVTCPIKYVEWMRDAMQRAFDIAHDHLQAKSYHPIVDGMGWF